MQRLFFTAVCAIVAGNGIITLFEKLVYSQKKLDTLHEVLVQGGSYAEKGSQYPPELLFQKMMAWCLAALVAGLVTALLKPAHSKYVKGAVLLFFIMAALVNVTIVPHPAWFAAAVPAVFIVPLLAGAQIPGLLKQLKAMPVEVTDRNTAGSGMQPAAV